MLDEILMLEEELRERLQRLNEKEEAKNNCKDN